MIYFTESQFLVSLDMLNSLSVLIPFRGIFCIFAAESICKNTMEETIILHDLGIGYSTKNAQRVVARHLHASLGSELTCLIGANGVGKSTLLRTLAAFQPSLEGQVLLRRQPTEENGADVKFCPVQDFTPQQLARRISVVLTDKPDVQQMTVTELIGMGRSPYTGFWGTLSSVDMQVVDEAILQVGISNLRNRMVHTLSDGERQKVMIAKALAQQTPIVLLDEPTAFLDFPSKVETFQLLRRLAHELHKTILLSTHDVELAIQLADRLWLMDKSTVDGLPQEQRTARLLVGTPRELADAGDLSRFIERKGIVFDKATLTIRVR